jgi:hypothetical protein
MVDDDTAKVDATVRAAVSLSDTDTLAKNVATNARLFCALVCLVDIAAQHYALAIWMAAPVGLAAIVDQLPPPAKAIASMGTYALAAVIAVASLIAIG